ncbi:MAG: hypothetical protein J5J06_02865 [Phycisphaerae bacterium]|nr:hypothetical protein [Phycisphaerae bacterium]
MAKIKIEDSVFDRVKRVAEIAGYATPEEFVVHVIERELERIEGSEGAADEQQVIDRLKGLGYLE